MLALEGGKKRYRRHSKKHGKKQSKKHLRKTMRKSRRMRKSYKQRAGYGWGGTNQDPSTEPTPGQSGGWGCTAM